MSLWRVAPWHIPTIVIYHVSSGGIASSWSSLYVTRLGTFGDTTHFTLGLVLLAPETRTVGDMARFLPICQIPNQSCITTCVG